MQEAKSIIVDIKSINDEPKTVIDEPKSINDDIKRFIDDIKSIIDDIKRFIVDVKSIIDDIKRFNDDAKRVNLAVVSLLCKLKLNIAEKKWNSCRKAALHQSAIIYRRMPKKWVCIGR